jgi:hypothetical protein
MSAFGPKQTWAVALHMSAFGGKADNDVCAKCLLLTQSGQGGDLAEGCQSPVLRRPLWRRVGRQGDPGVARLLPHRDGWRREIRVGEIADGNGNVSRKAFALPVDGGTTDRTEMKGHCVSAVGGPHPRRSLTGEGDLLAAEARLVADHTPGATLALQTVAHRDARWLAIDCKVKLPAVAGGASGGHGRLRDCR